MPLTPPPCDANGEVVPHDHLGILPDDGLIRRISEQLVINDQRRGCRRISSMAFKPSSGDRGGMSVDLQSLIEEAGLNTKAYVTTPRWIGSVRFVARDLRATGLLVGYHPIPDNPHHGEVWGCFTRSQQRALQTACEWFVEIPGAAIG